MNARASARPGTPRRASRGWPLCLAVCAACAGGPRATEDRAARDPIDGVIEPVMAKLHVPGMGVAIVQGGAVEKLRGYGVASLEWPTPVDATTRFQIASSTKVFTGTLVMLLVQDGKLALDRSVSAYLPDAPAAWQGMTVRQLAAHAGGLPDDVDPALASVADAYAALKGKPLRFPPGTQSRYGTGDFIVLAHAIETVTGQRFDELLRARIFAPLGFTCTSFDHASQEGPVRTADVIGNRATVYRWKGDRQRSARYLYPEYTYASGGLFSCLADLARWAAAMDRHTLLTAESERAMAAGFRIGEQDTGFGVVFSVGELRGRRWFGHSGGPALADVLRLPDEQLTVIVLANQQRLYPNLAARIASELLPPAAPPPAGADADPAGSARLRQVAEQMQTGALDDAAFTSALRAEVVPMLREWGPLQLASLPALDRFVLASERRSDRGRVRTYRAGYGKTNGRWTFTLDDQGRIADLDFAID